MVLTCQVTNVDNDQIEFGLSIRFPSSEVETTISTLDLFPYLIETLIVSILNTQN
jgi:hypothetical protein